MNNPRIQVQEAKQDVYSAMRIIGIIGVLQELRSCCLATVTGCDDAVQGYYANVSRLLAETAAEVTRLSEQSKEEASGKKAWQATA